MTTPITSQHSRNTASGIYKSIQECEFYNIHGFCDALKGKCNNDGDKSLCSSYQYSLSPLGVKLGNSVEKKIKYHTLDNRTKPEDTKIHPDILSPLDKFYLRYPTYNGGRI